MNLRLCPPFFLQRGYPRGRISYGSGAPPLLRRLRNLRYAFRKAWARSACNSPRSSIPTESRTREGSKKRYRPEEIISKLREADVLISQGKKVVEVIKALGVTDVAYFPWRQEYGGWTR
jgi:putative transposase